MLVHDLQMIALDGIIIWVHEPLLDEFDSLRGFHVHKPRYIVKNEGVDCLTDPSGDFLVFLKLETRLDIIKPDEYILSDGRLLKVHL